MIEKMCRFAILRYVPDEVRQEFINIGLVFHSPEDQFIDIRLTNNFSRVHAFDDEVDIEFLKLVLDGVKKEFSLEFNINRPSYDDLCSWSFLESATSIYNNQLQFSNVYTIRSKNFQNDFDDLFKTYVYFDVHRNQRISGDRVKSIMNRVLKDKDVFSKLKRDIQVDIGSEEITMDYKYESENKTKVIKTFSFDYTERGSGTASQVAKEWAWNFSKMRSANVKTQLQFDKNLEVVTFVYLGNKNKGKNIDLALEILRAESEELVRADKPEGIELFADRITNEIVF